MVQVPGPRMVRMASLKAHGPSLLMVTGLPDDEVGVRVTVLPCVSVPTGPGVQAGAPVGVTVIESVVGAGWMFTTWEALPLY